MVWLSGPERSAACRFFVLRIWGSRSAQRRRKRPAHPSWCRPFRSPAAIAWLLIARPCRYPLSKSSAEKRPRRPAGRDELGGPLRGSARRYRDRPKRGNGRGIGGIGIKTSPAALGDTTIGGSAGRGGTSGLVIAAFAEDGSVVSGAVIARTLAGAGRGNGTAANTFGRARGSGTRLRNSLGSAGRASPLIAGRNSGRSRSSIWAKRCENAGVAAIPASASVAKIALTYQLYDLQLILTRTQLPVETMAKRPHQADIIIAAANSVHIPNPQRCVLGKSRLSRLLRCTVDGYGRDGCFQPPPAQIPACAANTVVTTKMVTVSW
jgi:hypothetical protein